MPAKFNNEGDNLRTNINVHAEQSAYARKFSSVSQTNNGSNSNTRPNAEHIVDQAVGLKTTAVAADHAASLARDSLKNLRDSFIKNINVVNKDAVGVKSNFSDEDVAISRRQISDKLSNKLTQSDERYKYAIRDLVQQPSERFLLTRNNTKLSGLFNTAVPEIDHITVDMNKKKGTTDCFYSSIVFSLSRDKVLSGDIKAIRIFRATITNPKFAREIVNLSAHGVELIRTDKNRVRSKNNDTIGNLERKLRESNVPNSISAMMPADTFSGPRNIIAIGNSGINAAVSQTSRNMSNESTSEDVRSYIDSSVFSGLDRSVANDLKSLRNIQLQNNHVSKLIKEDTLHVGRGIIHKLSNNRIKAEQFRQNEINEFASNLDVVSGLDNKQVFKEIAFISPDKLNNRIIGDYIEYLFEDESISYGLAYRYFITTVDKNLHESVRSRIVDVYVDGLRVPECPKRLTPNIINNKLSLSILVDDRLVEKFEIYRKDDNLPRKNKSEVRHIGSSRTGHTVQKEMHVRNSNGFLLIGEALNSNRGSTFHDKNVQIGHSYKYRVYSVDIFNNKSERPLEIEVYIPDPSHKIANLKKPNILVEVDAKTNKARVTISSDDPKIEGLFLARRDLTLRQQAFVPPGQISKINLSNANDAQGSRKFEGVRIFDQSKHVAWTGFFKNTNKRHVFIDHSVSLDHIYQYQIYGVDRYGNRTSYEISKAVQIIRRPLINAPLNLNASLVISSDGTIGGVKLHWNDGNEDISSEDRLGNREVLANNSVRTLFQIERRRVGDEKWEEFPMIEEKEFFDPTKFGVNGVVAPNYRPPYVMENERYVYRIQTLQAGTFISNFSAPIEVFVGTTVQPPANFRIRYPDTKIRPFYVMLNWDTNSNSGVIDHWEIERVAVNNFAAAKINIKNLNDFLSLDFKPFRKIFKESSRFASKIADTKVLSRQRIQGLSLSGEHHFMDTAIEFGNSYFYRIRAVNINGEKSNWISRGIKIADQIIEKKINTVIRQSERQASIISHLPITFPANFFAGPKQSVQSSFGIVSAFASPSKLSIPRKIAGNQFNTTQKARR